MNLSHKACTFSHCAAAASKLAKCQNAILVSQSTNLNSKLPLNLANIDWALVIKNFFFGQVLSNDFQTCYIGSAFSCVNIHGSSSNISRAGQVLVSSGGLR